MVVKQGMHAAFGIFEGRYRSGGHPFDQPKDQAGIIVGTLSKSKGKWIHFFTSGFKDQIFFTHSKCNSCIKANRTSVSS